MSEMQRNKGIVKRLSTKENAKEVFDKLVADGIVDPRFCEADEKGVYYIDHEDYAVVNGAIFDVSGAPDLYDDYGEVNDAERLNDTDYRVHAYYYNGGANLAEMLDESIPLADAEYEKKDNKVVNDLAKYYLIKKQTELETKIQVYEDLMGVLDPAATRTEFVFKVQNAIGYKLQICKQKLKELNGDGEKEERPY